LQALGIAEIKMGKGGGARVARGNPRLFGHRKAGHRRGKTPEKHA
jgi:GntR family transcriptional repressor for pyruvate dehydrogenase complex